MADALHTPGVTSAPEARFDDAGLLTIGAAGLTSARTGVLHGPGSTALVTGTSSTSPMRYAVAAHHFVTSRGVASDGVYRGGFETAQLVDTTAAPGSGSRIDIIWVKQLDATSTISPDGSTAAQVGCTQGASSTGTPAAPAIPVGAEEIARVTVAAGATRTDGAGVTITQTAKQVAARGAPVPVRTKAERDALDKYVGLTVKRLDLSGREQRWTGSAWADPSDVPVLASIADRNAYFSGELRAGASALVAGNQHVYDGAAWRFIIWATISATTDGNGLISYAHGAGQGCTSAQLTLVNSGNNANDWRANPKVQSLLDPNLLVIEISRQDTFTAFANNAFVLFAQLKF